MTDRCLLHLVKPHLPVLKSQPLFSENSDFYVYFLDTFLFFRAATESWGPGLLRLASKQDVISPKYDVTAPSYPFLEILKID